MSLKNICEVLKGNTYPGRGILIGKSADGKNAVIAYFIMGRSENSRNRVFVEVKDGLRTKAYDESKLTDPLLIIYSPVKIFDNSTIVTNGDQTDTIYDFLGEDKTFEEALRTREFEPDAPNYTPRISGVATINSTFEYKLSILKSSQGDPSQCQRFFFEYDAPINGQGHFISTYVCDGSPIPSFYGEPIAVSLDGDIDSFSDKLWQSLNEDNKVSLFVRYIDINTGETATKIINKNI